MKVEVLLSCMRQTDVPALINRTNIQSDVLVINQSDVDKRETYKFINNRKEECTARIIHTTERGLSRSRNMALKNASGDLCLICDDDEILESDYPERIVKAFHECPESSIIAFRLNRPKRNYPLKSYRVNYLKAGRISSVQLCIKRCDLNSQIRFCEIMGSGTGNGGGEENKFIIDCIKQGLKIRYVPYLIGSVAQTESQWFHGFDRTYWINRGWTAKMIYGYFIGYSYLWYTLLLRSYKIDHTNHWYNQLIWMHKGFFDKR